MSQLPVFGVYRKFIEKNIEFSNKLDEKLDGFLKRLLNRPPEAALFGGARGEKASENRLDSIGQSEQKERVS